MLFLTQKQQQYIALARETDGKCGYVDVFVKLGDETYELYWSYMPRPGYPLLSFIYIVQPNLLLLINQTGELSLINLDSKDELATSKIGSSFLLGAGIYPSETKGFIVDKNPEKKGIDIIEFELNSLKTRFNQTIPGIFDINTLKALNENQLVGYIPVGSTAETNSSDGFLTIDTIKKSYNQHFLRPAPSGNFSQPPVAFDPRSKIGIRPSFEPIEIVADNGKNTYYAKLLLFDLNTGKKIRNIVVREFSASELFEDDNPDYALSCFELPPYSDDYIDVKEEFLERFEEIQFCHSEDAFWVTFQHGFLRKITFEGKYKSPLIVHPGNPDLISKNQFEGNGFDTPLDLSPDDRFISFGLPSLTLNTNDLERRKIDTKLLITRDDILESGCEQESKNTIIFSWNELYFDSLDIPAATDQVLSTLLDKTKDIELLRDGPYFRFLFNVNGEILSEAQFFQKVEFNEEQRSLGRKMMENLISFGEPLRYDEATPAFFFIIRKMVLLDVNQLDVLIRYIRLFSDCNSDQDSLKDLIDEIIEKYGWIKETIDLILTRACFQPENGLEQLEYYLKQAEFELYQTNPVNKKYFQEHTLFRSLANEYFSLFYPHEDELFSAIEREDIKKLEQLLDQSPELDLIHPEFNLNSLDLAIEQGNKEIVDLLIKAGASSHTHKPKTDFPIPLHNIHQDISVDKAMRTLLNDLQRQQEELQKEIYDIEFSHMLNLSFTTEQSMLLDSKNKELEEIQSQIKYANLGLLSLEDLTSSAEPDLQPLLPLESDSNNSAGSNNYISDQSYAYEDLSTTLIEIEDLHEKSQIYAFERMKLLLNNTNNIILDQVLRFNFKIAGRITSEENFFEAIQLTSISAQKLVDFVHSLTTAITKPIWYDDEIPGGFYAIQKLALYKKDFIEDFIFYLDSGIVDEEEPACITDLVFDLYEKYGWNTSTLRLVANRLCESRSSNGLSEFRIQWKKGGLKKKFRNTEIKEAFLRLLDKSSNENRIDWFKQFIHDPKKSG